MFFWELFDQVLYLIIDYTLLFNEVFFWAIMINCFILKWNFGVFFSPLKYQVGVLIIVKGIKRGVQFIYVLGYSFYI